MFCALIIPAFGSKDYGIRCHIGVHNAGGVMVVDIRDIAMETNPVTNIASTRIDSMHMMFLNYCQQIYSTRET